jgi:hypothetical protein
MTLPHRRSSRAERHDYARLPAPYCRLADAARFRASDRAHIAGSVRVEALRVAANIEHLTRAKGCRWSCASSLTILHSSGLPPSTTVQARRFVCCSTVRLGFDLLGGDGLRPVVFVMTDVIASIALWEAHGDLMRAAPSQAMSPPSRSTRCTPPSLIQQARTGAAAVVLGPNYGVAVYGTVDASKPKNRRPRCAARSTNTPDHNNAGSPAKGGHHGAPVNA